MIRREEVYKIGVFNKPHGIHGELSFTFTDDIFDRVEADYLICLLDGILVPFFLEEYRFRSDTTALVKLEGRLGEVTDVDTTTINTLFVVDHQGEELLIPAQEDFIVGIDQKHKVITVDLPEGLLALDETEEV